jgi:2-polyprenyl-3-methyl-5-hydroxy-6-metoxy-1,4-benzoquinol methylase
MPTEVALARYYATYYENATTKVTADIPGRLAEHLFRLCRPHLDDDPSRSFRVLDYGGGDGSISVELARKLNAHGVERVEIALIDYEKQVRDHDRERIRIEAMTGLEEVRDASMDMVIASAVLEHLPRPREVLEALLEALKPGGVFYARTPYIAPLASLLARFGIEIDFTYPAHLHDLGHKFWSRCLATTGRQRGYAIVRSTPSIVETSFGRHFLRSLAATLLKLPGYVFKASYPYVGGWEVVIRRSE